MADPIILAYTGPLPLPVKKPAGGNYCVAHFLLPFPAVAPAEGNYCKALPWFGKNVQIVTSSGSGQIYPRAGW